MIVNSLVGGFQNIIMILIKKLNIKSKYYILIII